MLFMLKTHEKILPHPFFRRNQQLFILKKDANPILDLHLLSV